MVCRATKHVTYQCDIFVSFEEFDIPHMVTAAGAESFPALGKATVEVLSFVGNKVQKIQLQDVWYVPTIGGNLFSALAATDPEDLKSFLDQMKTEFEITVKDASCFIGIELRNM